MGKRRALHGDPKGVAPEKVAVIVDLMAYLLTPEAQAHAYTEGILSGSRREERSTIDGAEGKPGRIKEYGRPEYEGWLKEFPHTQSLDAKAQVDAFRIWDQQVGAQKTK